MGKIQGYRCDGPACASVTETTELPAGWFSLVPIVSNGGDTSELVLCSNRCLLSLAKVRLKAANDRGEELTRSQMYQRNGTTKVRDE